MCMVLSLMRFKAFSLTGKASDKANLYVYIYVNIVKITNLNHSDRNVKYIILSDKQDRKCYL